jgi:hypothetical protein
MWETISMPATMRSMPTPERVMAYRCAVAIEIGATPEAGKLAAES